jgi:ankyrin repeat protein
MSVNMRESLDEALSKDPAMVQQTDDRGYTFLHQLSLAGSFDGVDVCLKHGADSRLPAPNGMTPYALAKCLEWKRVMERLQQAGASQ